MTRVLIWTPTYDNRLQDETVESIKAMQFNGELDWEVSDDNPHSGRDMRNVVYQFVKGRQLAIDGDYDGLMFIEHDMIVPPDCLQKLWDTEHVDRNGKAVETQVVYGTYELRHGMFAVNLFQYCGDTNIGMSLSLYPRELHQGRKAGQMRVSGAGFGCLLIKRPVFVNVPFRDVGNAPDLPFALDCVRKHIYCVGRTDVECGHIDLDKNMTLWPFEGRSGGMLARAIALQDVTVNDRGQTKILRKGKYCSLDVETARELQRGGYVKITNEADDVIDEIKDDYNDRAMGRETATDSIVSTRETATGPQTELADMTVSELREYAASLSVDLTGVTLKADIVAAIEDSEEE